MPLAAGTYAVFNTTEGKITVRLFETEAPITVKNFIDLAEGSREWTHPVTRAKSQDKLFDGTVFHRVIPDFMIQGGDPAGNGMGGPGAYSLADRQPHHLRRSGGRPGDRHQDLPGSARRPGQATQARGARIRGDRARRLMFRGQSHQANPQPSLGVRYFRFRHYHSSSAQFVPSDVAAA
jgi:cyclophilin family peptidyl-prolyl cis-trans isomerase